MSNIASVQNAISYLNVQSRVVCKSAEMRSYARIILPGVGAFGEAMRRIKRLGFHRELLELALHRQSPVLGICLGMQHLLESSS